MKRLRSDHAGAATATLAEAFWDDPLVQIAAPDERTRRASGPWFVGRTIEYGLRWGEVWGNDDASAVAVWLPPESGAMTMRRMLRIGGGALPLKIGARSSIRFLRAMSAIDRFHKLVHGPHWYLMMIGTRKAHQRQGLGSALMTIGTSRADAAGVPCYLDSGTQSNVDFYAKRGFEVVGQTEFQGFTLTGMVRQPR
jgi:ribosomal protein S18 acetylase RimI-like enzyme